MVPPYQYYFFSYLPSSVITEICRNRISLTYCKISVLSTLHPLNGIPALTTFFTAWYFNLLSFQ